MRPPPRVPERFAPVFILAPARSYSSVISTMIGQHPQLAGLPELKLFCYDTVAELQAPLSQYWIDRQVTHRSPGLVRALAEILLGDQSLPSLAAARRWLAGRPAWSGADVLDVLLERVSPRAGVEKSPDHALSQAALDRMAAAYPNARYIHLTRHPLTTQQSVQKHWQRMLPGYRPQPDDVSSGIAAWYEIHRRIQLFGAGLAPGRYLLVMAEAVLNDPVARLEAIARWLGVGTDPAAIEAMLHPEHSGFARMAPPESGVAGGHDHGFLQHPAPRRVPKPPALDVPAEWIGGAHAWRLVADLARGFGYGW